MIYVLDASAMIAYLRGEQGAEVVREAFTDPTATEGNWIAVELKPIKRLPRRVSLEEIKADKKLSQLALVRSPRLSVMPVTADEYRAILALSKG